MSRNPKFVWSDAFMSAGVHGNAGFIGYAMSQFDNGNGSGFFVSVETLADRTKLSKSTVERALAKLLESGWVTQTRKGSRFTGASHYRLTIPQPVSSDGLTEDINPSSVTVNPSILTHQPVRTDGPLDPLLDQTPSVSGTRPSVQDQPVRIDGLGWGAAPLPPPPWQRTGNDSEQSAPAPGKGWPSSVAKAAIPKNEELCNTAPAREGNCPACGLGMGWCRCDIGTITEENA